MPIFRLEASPPQDVEIELRDTILDLGAGSDSYICGRCAHVVATGGQRSVDGAAAITVACPGCGWTVHVPATQRASARPDERGMRRGSAAGGA